LGESFPELFDLAIYHFIASYLTESLTTAITFFICTVIYTYAIHILYSQLSCRHIMRTTVKWFNPTKGYGFLENGAGPDIYVNAKSLRGADKITVGDVVEFECHVFEGKLVARQVHPVRKQPRDQFNRIQQPHFVMQ